jgi:hypothetical protein
VTFPKRVVLHCSSGNTPKLEALVEDFLQDRVVLVAIAGADCRRVEDIVDELITANGSDLSRFINTTSHPDGGLMEAIEFAKSWRLDEGDNEAEVRVVEL